MIENLEERVFILEESIKDIADFVKEERLRRAEKKRDEAEDVQVQSRHSVTRAGRDDNGIKEALLEVAALEYASINADEVMIPKVAAVVEKENQDEGDEEKEEEKNEEVICEEENKADGSAGVEKEDHDEGEQDEDDKNEKNRCEEENNEGDGEKTEDKNAQEVKKEQHKEEGKSDAPEKVGIAEKDNENEFPNLAEFLNEVSQEIDKMMVETENIESLDNY
ncbi:glutamic acid-rich protein-like isoform X1 [Capsicum annuum]|uniref:glutamic acid-rich protein-like isoform X1 n=1 Tax=Capsicum annuum TaxID=4072 RepID=UPI001FB180B7|nr:glutamic acid-rich protein-like isoform X1 [Capsicum annuum]